MDLSTTYLGLELSHPLMPGASPMVVDLDVIRRLEDAGTSAIVMHSLFEEQIVGENEFASAYMDSHKESFGEALSFLPEPEAFRLGPEEYLEQIRKIREMVSVPVIASLNGTTTGGWLRYAKLMQEAGAHAIELNVYLLATDPETSSSKVEERVLAIHSKVKEEVNIPIAMKLSPYFSSLANLSRRLSDQGADGLVLFNRFYQPDIDIEELEVTRTLQLSNPSELLLRLRWLAILHGHVKSSLAVTGGVHQCADVVKAIMAGADVIQLVSALLRKGPEHIRKLHCELGEWLEKHEYESLKQMKGSMSLERCPNPEAYERANYVQILQSIS